MFKSTSCVTFERTYFIGPTDLKCTNLIFYSVGNVQFGFPEFNQATFAVDDLFIISSK